MKQSSAAERAVSRETTADLERYVDLLLRWNRTINLISRKDEAVVWERHIVDSLALLPLLPDDFSHAIDLGSGGGLPGIVLAICTRKPFHLVESDQRKCVFLREAARMLSLTVTVHAARIEAVQLPAAPLITARALAPLPILLGWSVRLLAPGGICVFPKGRSVDEELTAAASEWHMKAESVPSPTDQAARFLRISEIERVGSAT